jgi:hypothetical protein
MKQKFCWACTETIDILDKFCRHCGKPQEDGDLPWYYQPKWILILTITVIGPGSLPLIWKSPKFDTKTKWITSILVIIISILLGWLFIKLMFFSYTMFQSIIKQQPGALPF